MLFAFVNKGQGAVIMTNSDGGNELVFEILRSLSSVYGWSILQPKEVALVEIAPPKDNEVLVKVHATTVTIGDTIMRSLNMPIHGWQKIMARLILGWRKPKRPILGMELAGEIESVGRKVTRFKPGDPVFASTFAVNFGGYAEYKCLPENGVIALKPANLTYEEAAAVPGAGQTAWQCLKKGKSSPGKKC